MSIKAQKWKVNQMLRLTLAALMSLAVSTGSAAGGWKPLLSPVELAGLLAEEPILVDIRSVAEYNQGHVAGAVSVPYHAWRGPDANPGALIPDDKLTLILSELGVEVGSRVVVTYRGADATDFGGAARVYWTLKSAGVGEIAILNGGIEAWVAAGQPLSTSEASNFPSDLEFSFAPDWLADREEVRDVVEGRREALLVDARPDAYFIGADRHELAAWAGTLAGALNLDYSNWFPAQTVGGGTLIADPATLRAIATHAGYVPGGVPIVSFCNTGHWAATNWFVLSEVAGIEGVKLYPESMVGWTQAVGRIAKAE
jgi:thiosulfate/3-mercaptopyruvate sulfurtransferase